MAKPADETPRARVFDAPPFEACVKYLICVFHTRTYAHTHTHIHTHTRTHARTHVHTHTHIHTHSHTHKHTQRKINQGCHATPRKDIYAESTRRLKVLASGARPAVVPNSFGPSTCSRRNIRSTALPSSESRSWLDKWRQCARSRVSTTAEASHLLARSHGRRRRSASAATERCQPSRESEYGATR